MEKLSNLPVVMLPDSILLHTNSVSSMAQVE